MYINSHDHLNFYSDLESSLEIINKKKILTLGCSMDLESFEFTRSLKEVSDFILLGFGIHPFNIRGEIDLDCLDHPSLSADFLGEIGLDFFWNKDRANYENQIKVFKYFLKKSHELNKISNIHTKGAEDLVLELLKNYRVPSPIIHWYSGNLDLVDDFLDLDAYFTISVDVGHSKKTDRLIEKLPLNRILLETDGETSLQWINGRPSPPDYLEEILKYVARLKNLEEAQLLEITNKNFERIYKKRPF